MPTHRIWPKVDGATHVGGFASHGLTAHEHMSSGGSFELAPALAKLHSLLQRRTRSSDRHGSEAHTLLHDMTSHLLATAATQSDDVSPENWQTMRAIFTAMRDGDAGDAMLTDALRLLQLFVCHCPVARRVEMYEEAFETVRPLGLPSSGSLLAPLMALLATVHPTLLTAHLLRHGRTECLVETHVRGVVGEFVAATLAANVSSAAFRAHSVQLAGLRLMQAVILAKTVHSTGDDEPMDPELGTHEGPDRIAQLLAEVSSERLGVSLVATETRGEDEGVALFRDFLRLGRDGSAAWGAGAMTAWLALLHPLLSTRPTLLPTLIPALLGLAERPLPDHFSPAQQRNILHALRAALSTLVSVPRAEKFYSLVLEALDKCVVPEAGGRERGTTDVSGSPSVPVDDEETREIEASLGGLQERAARPSAAFASATEPTGEAGDASASTVAQSGYDTLASPALTRELLKIPPPLVVDMVVRMLGTWTGEQIEGALMRRWPQRAAPAEEPTTGGEERRSTTEAFVLRAEPLDADMPGEIVHLSMARILQTLSELAEFHAAGRREETAVAGTGLIQPAGDVLAPGGIPAPLLPACRLVALIAAHVGAVRSAVLVDPERRRRRLDRRLDPRQQAKRVKRPSRDERETSTASAIFDASSSEDDDSSDDDDDDEKSVNQILLAWINEDLPGRFDFVWYWLEAVWIAEGKQGSDAGTGATTGEAEDTSEYGRLFDDIVGLAGEHFLGASRTEGDSVGRLERVLGLFLRLPRLNLTFIRNLLYPLMGEERLRPTALAHLARLFLARPALRPMLADFVLTLVQSDDAAQRHDTINLLLLQGDLYPGLRSLSTQLEACSLDMMDSVVLTERREEDEPDRADGSDGAEADTEAAMTAMAIVDEKEAKESQDLQTPAIKMEDDTAPASATTQSPELDATSPEEEEFTAAADLFLGLLRKNPAVLLPPLFVRFSRFSRRLQRMLLERALPQVVASWRARELTGVLSVFDSDGETMARGGELVVRLVESILALHATLPPEAELVDFFDRFAELVQAKLVAGVWDGRLVTSLLPWILCDRSDLPDFFALYLPCLVTAGSGVAEAAFDRVCAAGDGRLVSPVQLLVQLHLLPSTVPLPAQIETIQRCLEQAAEGATRVPLFTPTVVSAALGQLVDGTPLSPLLGRSLLQTVPRLAPAPPAPLNVSFMLSLLTRLVSRRIWESSHLWEGWVRCCRALLPGSLGVLLQLPAAQLERLLSASGSGADFRAPLKEHLYNQPPSIRNRYAAILTSLERKR